MIDWQSIIPEDALHLVRPETGSKYFPKNPLRQRLLVNFLEKITGLVKSSGAAEILDVGCGEGLVDFYISGKEPGLRIWGGDADREVLELARRLNPNGVYLPLDATNLPFDDSSFEVVMMNEVLEHLENFEAAVAEAARVAARVAIFSVPHWPLYQTANFLILKNLRTFGEHPDHVKQFSKSGFRKILENHFKRGVEVDTSFPWIIAYAIK